MPLPMIAAALFGAFGTYFVAKVSTGRNDGVRRQEPLLPTAPPPVSKPRPPAIVEPPPRPVEATPPPPAPIPPPDTSTKLPTPPPVAVVEPPPPPPPAATKPPPAIVEPPPAAVEATPPPPAPEPPPDASPTLPTPKQERPFSDVVVDVPVPVRSGPAPSSPVELPAPADSAADGPPAGFDGTRASALAPSVAKDIATRQYSYSHDGLREFQRAAGIATDGIYGNDSWGALLYFTSDAPKALFKPTIPTPYPWGKFVSGPSSSSSSLVAEPPTAAVDATPPTLAAPPDVQAQVGPVPPAGFNPAAARKLAKQVASNLDSKGRANYSRDLMKQFQTAAGIDADGLYGGGSRRALMFYGVARPPQPFFKPTATPPDYPWANQATS